MFGARRAPQIYDQRITPLEIGLNAVVGVADGVGVGLSLPFSVVDTSIRFLSLETGQVLALDYEDIHHRDETLTGLRDARLWVEARFGLGGWALSGRAGSTIPLGRTEPDPFLAALQGRRHQHVQFGSGTFAPLAGASARRPFNGWALDSWAHAEAPLYANRHGHRASARLGMALGAQSAFGLPGWSFHAALAATGETSERWPSDGMPHAMEEGNRGRVDLALSGGVRLPVGPAALQLGVRVPFWTRTQGDQVEYPAVVDMGVETDLALW